MRKVCFSPLVLALLLIVSSCSKNSDAPPEDVISEDTAISYPCVMLARSERKGAARIFSNGQEIPDPAYAASFVASADLFYFQNSSPPRKIQLESADTIGIFYNEEPAKYGIHKDDTTLYLHDRYPMGPITVEDTVMVAYTINAQTGMAHPVLTAYGDHREIRIPVFAYRRQKYAVDAYGNVYPSVGSTSYRYTAFKESFKSTLGPRDTFAIQEYEMVFRK